MLQIKATSELPFSDLNEIIRKSSDKCVEITGTAGQRYIGAGLSERIIDIKGTPGNALGAYLDGSSITVHGNVQDATGDTMNEGEIIVHGNAGDATGYAMRGGAIYIRGDTGYRTGIHMKAYKALKPAIVIGGRAGSFLGEYLAGGVIIVLGLNPAPDAAAGSPAERPVVSNFVGTGMHGGAIYIRTDQKLDLPKHIKTKTAAGKDLADIKQYIKKFCEYFTDTCEEYILDSTFTVLAPDSNNPYKQLYTTD